MSILSTGTELKRFRRGALPKIAIAVLLFIPLIYGALYLWAFWAPTDNMDKLPVAIVNLDEPARQPDGGELSAGADVVDELIDGGEIAWRPQSAEQAERAVADGDVYFSVTIPRDFSSTLAGLQDDPKPGRIEVVYNDANSFLASTLGKQAMVQVRDAVAETATQTAADRILVGVEQLSDGTRDAAEAASRLDAGAGDLARGGDELSLGLGDLADGTARLVAQAPSLTAGTADLANGLSAAREGSSALADGTATLAEKSGEAAGGAARLEDGLGRLHAGAGELGTRLGEAADGAARLTEGASSLSDGAGTLAAGSEALETGAGQLAEGAAQLSDGTSRLAEGADALHAGASELADGAATARTGAESLAGGLDALGSGSARLETATAALAQLAGANPDMTLAQLDAVLQQQGSSLAQLASGASELRGGVDQAGQGAHALADGAATLDEGAAQLRDRSAELSAGASATRDGAAQLSAATAQLAEKSGELNAGAQTLSARSTELRDGAASLGSGAQQLRDGAHSLETGIGEASEGSSTLASGTEQLSAGAAQLADGGQALAQGVASASDGADRLNAGAASLAAGATQLDAGAQRADEGAAQLADGAKQLHEGSDEFATRLAEGADEAPEFAPGQTTGIAETMAAPVTLDESTENAVQGFGGGFAPFFIALATFVGALITWLILHPLPKRPMATNTSGLRTVLTGFWPAALIGVGQVVIMMLVLVYGIGLAPVHWVGMAGFMLLATLAFLALQQMFVVLLGSAAGRVVSLVLLMLQLSSSGGTYPVETTPVFFQVLHPFMPASYVVDGLRQLIGGGVDARFWIALLFMSLLLAGSLAISAVAARRQKVWTIARLRPELAI